MPLPRYDTSHWRLDRKTIASEFRSDCIAAFGEFCGIILFLGLSFGGIQAAATSRLANGGDPNATPTVDQLVFIATAMGLSLLSAAWIFYRATGAAFNPSVSFALLLVGCIKPVRFVLYCIAQFVGAIVASALLDGLTPGPLYVGVALGPGVNKAQGVFIEAFITAGLCLAVLFLAVEKHKSTFLAPVGIGITLFAAHLFAVLYTGSGMNPARAFGPAVISGFTSNHWIWWLGPTLGAIFASVLYAFFKATQYWRLNPDQDTADHTESPDLFTRPAAEKPPPTTTTTATGNVNGNGSSSDRMV